MFLFLKVVLAHLIADFILQFEELYQLKVRSFLGQLVHVLIHGLVTAFVLFPYLNEPLILVYIVALMAEHLIQDLIKYHFTKKFPHKAFIYYSIDQVIHGLALATIFLFPVSNEVRGFRNEAFLSNVYQSNAFTGLLIFFILLTFAANYTLNSFYRSYLKNVRPTRWITSSEMAITLAERTTIAGTVIFSGNPLAVLISLAVGLLRLPFPSLKNGADFTVSALLSVVMSYLFLSLL